MSKITLAPNPSGTGIFTVAAPNSNTDRTLTLPDATGTLVNTDASGNLLVGTTTNTNSSRIVSNGVIESTTGGVRFPDGTTQTTAAAASSYVGARGQAFTSNGTFTIPSGITALKITVVGGGGGGSGLSGTAGTGGTSSVASGTQSITTISASGGAGGGSSQPGSGGIGSNGTLNIGGSAGTAQGGGTGGASSLGGGGLASSAGRAFGGGGGAENSGRSGGGGGTAISFLTGLTPGNTLAVTIGGGGSPTSTNYCGSIVFGGAGAAGVVIFEW